MSELAMPSEGVDGQATVLCVDDEPNVLSALRRTLRSPGYRILTADGGARALELMRQEAIDVLISDMRMPEMDGAQLLEHAREGWPRTVRILLTGHADMQSAIAAINRAHVDRYMSKPWEEQELVAAVRQAVDLIALRREKERLDALTRTQNDELRTLNVELEGRVEQRTAALSEANKKLTRNFLTSIKVFSNLIELRGGLEGIGHGRRVADLARKIAFEVGLDIAHVQDIFVAGLLHDIGLIGLPDAILGKPTARLRSDENVELCRHAKLGEEALIALEDLQAAAALIRSHHERFDGDGYPDRLAGDEIPLGARIVAIADVFDDLQYGRITAARASYEQARTLLRQGRGTQFDPELLDVFLQLTEPERVRESSDVQVSADALEPGMVLAADLVSKHGVLLLAAGQRLEPLLIRRIREFQRRSGDVLLLKVRSPVPRGNEDPPARSAT